MPGALFNIYLGGGDTHAGSTECTSRTMNKVRNDTDGKGKEDKHNKGQPLFRRLDIVAISLNNIDSSFGATSLRQSLGR
jgi:hypothetical protein